MARESARQPRRSRTDKAAIQQAERLSNRKQVAGELEQQVAQRTTELAEANQKLSKEIGERREIEKRLHESESVLQKALYEITTSETKLRQVIDTIPALAWCNLPDGSNEFLNRRWHEYTGLSPEESHGWGWQVAFHPEDLPALMKRWGEMLVSGEPGEIEARLRRHDGVYRWFLIRAEPLHDEIGKIVRWYGTSTDIEDRKRAEEQLRRGEAFLVEGQRLSRTGTFSWRVETGEIRWSEELYRIFDFAPDLAVTLELIGSRVHPEDLPTLGEMIDRAKRGDNQFEYEHRIVMPGGLTKYIHLIGHAVRDAEGHVEYFGAAHDITQRRIAEQALGASERNLSMIINTMPALAWSARPDGEAEFFNQRWLDYTGLSAEQSRGWGWMSAIHRDDVNAITDYCHSTLASGKAAEVEARICRIDGAYRWFLFRTDPLRDESGNIVKWYGTITDIEDHKRLEETLRANELSLRQIVDNIPGFVHTTSAMGEVEFLSRQTIEYFGKTKEELKDWSQLGIVHPDDLPRVVEVWRRAIESGQDYEVEQRNRRFDGIYRWFQSRGHAVRDEKGEITAWYWLNTDIDDRKRAEAEVKESYLRLAEAQQLSKTGSFITDLVADDHNWSEETFRIFDFDPSTKVTVQMIRNMIYPHDLPSFDSMIARAMTGANVDFVFRILTSRGAMKHIRGMARVIEQIAGRPLFIGALQDVTESKLAEDALNKARSELAHVARVTTLNALTASIAHEVNQPLSGIITNASTCLRMLNSDPPNVDGARETARRAIRDGNRASDVITRLRALFSKRELTLEPLDLSEATREVIALSLSDLQRNRVTLRSELADDLPRVIGDRVQLQQVILNLVRNASDAMVCVDDRPRELLIKTERDEGDRVRLSVIDAGIGFRPEAGDKLFEAFYTTKNDGMGIGLSVSRSIIEAHHGRLWATPNDGPGATFSFSLPYVTDTKVQ